MMKVNIISIQAEHAPKIYRIGLSDGRLFSIKTVYLKEDFISHITPPFELSEDKDAELRFSYACLRAERIALSFIAHAEQNSFCLARKLQERGHAPSCVRAVIDHLSDIEAVSDERYAALWVQSRLSLKSDSPNRLLAKLCDKGIPCGTAKEALNAALDGETEYALLKKFAAKNRLDAEPLHIRRQKLKREGFSSEVIRMVGEEKQD
ncbi:MAG: recombination regulator RecX [Treponema sp.]|jgi:SOS response regulatory protein OraA/RecX|nr:recombination regulator RecX [Treponema sp.]